MKQITLSIAKIESILFVAGEPVTFTKLCSILHLQTEELQEAVKALKEKYENDPLSGLFLVVHKETVLLATKAEFQPFIEALTKETLQENLSKAQLEVLAVIAYRGPISKSEIEAIRGVNCSYTLRNLLLRELIERDGAKENIRGYVYTISPQFLLTLGLSTNADLPDYEDLHTDKRLEEIIEKDTLRSELSEGKGEDL